MDKDSVRSWPAYVLHRKGGIPEPLRAAISADAAEQNLSLADTIRGILCAHYALDCPPRGSGYDSDRDGGAQMMVLRLQPALFKALNRDAKKRKQSLRSLILTALEAHYLEVPAK